MPRLVKKKAAKKKVGKNVVKKAGVKTRARLARH